jgi:hypothetical protein
MNNKNPILPILPILPMRVWVLTLLRVLASAFASKSSLTAPSPPLQEEYINAEYPSWERYSDS